MNLERKENIRPVNSLTKLFGAGKINRFFVVPILALLVGCGGSSASSDISPDIADITADTIRDSDSGDAVSDEKRVISIMAVGDSITHGVPDPGPSASWRLPFSLNMDNDGCTYQMVGSQQTNESHSAFESAHEAYSAQQAGHFLTGFTNYAGTNRGIYEAMQNYSPDIVLLHIGTNDAINAQANEETVREIDQIVATILDGEGVVLVANVIPSYSDQYFVGVDARIADLGSQIEAYVVQLGNPRVQIVDVRSGYSAELMYDDGIHPNEDGSQHIANAFYTAYKAAGYCN